MTTVLISWLDKCEFNLIFNTMVCVQDVTTKYRWIHVSSVLDSKKVTLTEFEPEISANSLSYKLELALFQQTTLLRA
jgi:hypothetical protein